MWQESRSLLVNVLLIMICFKKNNRGMVVFLFFIRGVCIIGHFQQLTQKHLIFQLDNNLICAFSKTTGYSAPCG